jgi:hypothetical protein
LDRAVISRVVADLRVILQHSFSILRNTLSPSSETPGSIHIIRNTRLTTCRDDIKDVPAQRIYPEKPVEDKSTSL